jgi:putative FmdB family regulatory protein
MPIFEFTCAACGKEFEELVRSAEERVECPKCGAAGASRKMSAFAFKSSGRFVAASGSGSCSGCRPGPSGCSGCSR